MVRGEWTVNNERGEGRVWMCVCVDGREGGRREKRRKKGWESSKERKERKEKEENKRETTQHYGPLI